MFRAIVACIRRVISSTSGAFGTGTSVMGAISEWTGQPVAVSGWVWLTLGAVLLFVTACRIEWELMQEKDKKRKPQANMNLEDVVKRIRGTDDIFGPNSSESAEVFKALKSLVEHGATGSLTIFGCKDVKCAPANYVDMAMPPRLPIPAEFWRTNSFDYTAFTGDRIGITRDGTSNDNAIGSGFGYIWFDRAQIDSIWPRPRSKINLRNPFRFKVRI